MARTSLTWRQITAGLLATTWVTLAQAAYAQWPTNGRALCTASGEQVECTIVADGLGGAIVAWRDSRNEAVGDIYAHHVLASGAVDPNWPVDGLAISTAPNLQEWPAIVSDGAGGAIVTWTGGPGVSVQHVLASGSVDPNWPVNGRLLAAVYGHYPQIVSDGAGGAIVTWEVGMDIYVQHVLASGVIDPAWPAGGRALCLASGIQDRPFLVSDGAGGAIVTWSDGRADPFFDIYAQHVLASGQVDPAWPVDGRAVCTATEDQGVTWGCILSDGAGGAIIGWGDKRSGNWDIYAHHILSSGATDPLWPTNGLAVCTAVGHQAGPWIVSDGSGNVIVAWSDSRADGIQYDLYGHHLLSSGAVDPGWPANGRALCVAPGDQRNVGMVSDGEGGAILGWSDNRNGNWDIYAQHMLASGALDSRWPESGAAVRNALSHVGGLPQVASDGSGGAIIAWQDQRSGLGNYDIYAQRADVGANFLVAVDLAPGEAFILPWLHPNPTRGGVTVSFELRSAQKVAVAVFDLAGREIWRLAPDPELPPGLHSFTWNDSGEPSPKSGVYLVRLTLGDRSITRKVALLR